MNFAAKLTQTSAAAKGKSTPSNGRARWANDAGRGRAFLVFPISVFDYSTSKYLIWSKFNHKAVPCPIIGPGRAPKHARAVYPTH
jgi:hypothetical protein